MSRSIKNIDITKYATTVVVDTFAFDYAFIKVRDIPE